MVSALCLDAIGEGARHVRFGEQDWPLFRAKTEMAKVDSNVHYPVSIAVDRLCRLWLVWFDVDADELQRLFTIAGCNETKKQLALGRVLRDLR